MMADAFGRAAERVETERRRRDRAGLPQSHGWMQRTAFRIHATALRRGANPDRRHLGDSLSARRHRPPLVRLPAAGLGHRIGVHYAAVRDSWRALPAADIDAQPGSTATDVPLREQTGTGSDDHGSQTVAEHRDKEIPDTLRRNHFPRCPRPLSLDYLKKYYYQYHYYYCRFSNPLSSRDFLACTDAGCLTSCPHRFLSRSCPLFQAGA